MLGLTKAHPNYVYGTCTYVAVHVYSLYNLAEIKASLNTRYEVDLGIDTSKLFKYVIPEEGIRIHLKVFKGKMTFYGSHSNPDPNPAWHDYMLLNIHGDRDIAISHPISRAEKRKEDKSTVSFYCNLVGLENTTLTIKAVKGI